MLFHYYLYLVSYLFNIFLPYVIIAVSGSGPIAAVPLAIFAVSTAVALISKIYLIRLAVSRADNKKEAGLNGQEFGHTASQELVCGNCANLESKPIGKGFDKSVKQDSGSKTEVRGSEHVDTNPKLTPQQPPPPPPPKQLNQASVAARKNSARLCEQNFRVTI